MANWKKMKRTVFNNVHEAKFNPWKTYYGVITVGDKCFLSMYNCKFRSEATAVFESEAKAMGGKLDTFGVLK